MAIFSSLCESAAIVTTGFRSRKRESLARPHRSRTAFTNGRHVGFSIQADFLAFAPYGNLSDTLNSLLLNQPETFRGYAIPKSGAPPPEGTP
jgi:hypothetical protein